MSGRTSPRDERAELSPPEATKAKRTQKQLEVAENYQTGVYRSRGVTGDNTGRRRGRFTSGLTQTQRFWSHVHRVPGDGCWIWQGQLTRDGYGRFTVVIQAGTYRTLRAHRFAYQLVYGPIPHGLTIDHLCGQRACVRPDHLEAVTHAENLRRRHARRRQQQAGQTDERSTPMTTSNAANAHRCRDHLAYIGPGSGMIGGHECLVCGRLYDKWDLESGGLLDELEHIRRRQEDDQ